MNANEIISYCLARPGSRESMPFGEDTLVFKVKGKIFLLLSLDVFPPEFNVKCNPVKALLLRERYACVKPGYHMNKKHWNTIVCDGTVSNVEMLEWISHSYELVLQALPAKERKK